MPSALDHTTTSHALRRLTYEYVLLSVGALVLLIFGAIWMLLRLGGPTVTELFADCLYLVAAGVGTGLAWLTAIRFRRASTQFPHNLQRAWFLVGLALFSDVLGGVYDVLHLQGGQILLSVSFADIGYILYAPLLFA